MTKLAIVLLLAIAAPLPAHAQQGTIRAESFYGRDGHFAGSSSARGNSTSFRDRSGHFSGSAIRNSDGTTSLYDASGHFVGSVRSKGHD